MTVVENQEVIIILTLDRMAIFGQKIVSIFTRKKNIFKNI